MAVAERILWLKPLTDRRSDETLVRAAKLGSSEAASALIERYYPRVKGFVTYLNGSSANAEDLTQEVFTRALGALSRFNGNYKVEPWLLRIARNLSIDESRRKAASPVDPAELPEYETSIPNADWVWDHISSDLAFERVRAVLQHLPDRQRAVLILKEIEGMSYADIAEVIGTNTRGVEATLRRARARFRMEMIKADSDEELRAVCRRTLRSIAAEAPGVPASLESAAHLRRCRECGQKVAAMRRADKAFALLPPIVATSPDRIRESLETVRAALERPRRLAEQSAVRMDFAGSFGALLQSVASLIVVAAVSVAPITSRKTVHIAQAALAMPEPIIAMASLDPVPEIATATTASPVADPASTDEVASSDTPTPKASLLLFSTDAMKLNLSLEGILVQTDVTDLELTVSSASEALSSAIGAIDTFTIDHSAPVAPALDIIPNATLVTATVSPMALPRRRFSCR